MKNVIYYVASSVDGHISGINDEINEFTQDPDFLKYYFEQLQNFKVVLMGKKTYEFGYRFGLKPGAKAYQHMDHYIFSTSINLPQSSEVIKVSSDWAEFVKKLKQTAPTDIYLCGGSQFASYLLEKNLIDQIWIKLNPFLMGVGKRLFSRQLHSRQLQLRNTKTFSCGVIENRYDLTKVIETPASPIPFRTD